MIRSSLLPFLVLSTFLLFPKVSYSDSNSYRLPTDVKPTRYFLTVQPDLSDETFNGSVKIDLEILKVTRNITVHKKHLLIVHSTVKVVDEDKNEVKILEMHGNKTNETFSVYVKEDLLPNRTYSLIIDCFKGSLKGRRDNRGFYSSMYFDESGEEKRYALTDFEPKDARAAFPCFDEPAFRAKFNIKIIRASNYTSVSNQELESSTHLNNGLYEDTFKESPRMSTYLVAFAVTDFGVASYEGRYRIFGRPETVRYDSYYLALHASKDILDALENYTGIPFPISKLDQISVPEMGFNTGAMENWGMITYRENFLLCSNTSNSFQIQICTSIVAHEIAHQWFGNLVGPLWWDSIWLNEGFAEFFMSYLPSLIRPKWRMMDQYMALTLQKAFTIDANIYYKDSIVGDDFLKATGINLIYKKGSAVIRMMQHFLTEDIFRQGLRHYLKTHQYTSVTSKDLYNSLQHTINETGISYLEKFTIEDVMKNWITKPGHPIVTVAINSSTGAITFTQQQFRFHEKSVHDDDDDDHETETLWHIPINYGFRSDPPEKLHKTTPDFWLVNKSHTIVLPKAKNLSNDWVLVNIDQTGFYRVNYDIQNWEKLISQLNSDNYRNIPTLTRAQLINDVFNLAKSKRIPYKTAFRLSNYLVRENDYAPIRTFFNYNTYIREYFKELFQRHKSNEIRDFWSTFNLSYTEPEEFAVTEAIKNYYIYLFQHIYENLGVRERSTDEYIDTLTRATILPRVCPYIERCKRDLIEDFEEIRKEENVGKVAHNMQYLVFCEGAKEKGGVDFLLQLYSRVKDHFVRKRIEMALKSYQAHMENLKDLTYIGIF